MSNPQEEVYHFNHDVNPTTAALTINAISKGPFPALEHTFSRSTTAPSPTKAAAESQQGKTVGFLALVGPPAASKILKWAQSGHGHGRHGDFLAKDKRTLQNRLWARRALKMADVLGFSRTASFDKGLRRDLSEEEAKKLKGIYKYSHVEVKLAVHAIYVLLRDFMPGFRGPVTMDQLLALRDARWSDGTKPEFKIVVSRLKCGNCKNMLAKISEVTGVKLHLVIGKRKQDYQYKQRAVENKKKKTGHDGDETATNQASSSDVQTPPALQTPPRNRAKRQPVTPLDSDKETVYPDKYLPATPVSKPPTPMR
ncbi:hypothetical protein CDD80_2976 [Ophiocordyceps camponoti-rufipedis]|uniref:Uncharacterized protein n=1 Tax=Ophiocordyceps camponoti-rufipedis TaxID=2004952 RepID=A0A2C5Z3K3_9HYPO|nr:hypothetical protein CDD80_2976 [Ophiocordyceps camponoti-rufipedis]